MNFYYYINIIVNNLLSYLRFYLAIYILYILVPTGEVDLLKLLEPNANVTFDPNDLSNPFLEGSGPKLELDSSDSISNVHFRTGQIYLEDKLQLRSYEDVEVDLYAYRFVKAFLIIV